MISKRDVQIASILGVKAITEASLGRVYQHFLKSGEKSWAIISAAKYELTPEENKNRDKRLKAWLSENGFGSESEKKGYFRVIGHWTQIDPQTKEPEVDPTGRTKQAKEQAFFVTGISRDQAVQVMNDFEQQAILYAGPETDRKVSLITQDGETMLFSKFSPQSFGDAFSTVKGKSFKFEYLELSVVPVGHIEAMSYFNTQTSLSRGAVEESSVRDLDLRLKSLWR